MVVWGGKKPEGHTEKQRSGKCESRPTCTCRAVKTMDNRDRDHIRRDTLVPAMYTLLVHLERDWPIIKFSKSTRLRMRQDDGSNGNVRNLQSARPLL